LAERVGRRGSVAEVERNEEAVRLAKQFVAERNLINVEVVHANGRSTGLAKCSFDFATARFVLVNVPHPEQIITEMAALARPGGTVALYEADLLGVFCDPPLAAWNRLIEVLQAYAEMNDIDLFVGRKTPRLLREAGLIDVQTEPIARISPQGHGHRALLLHFAENLRERLLARNVVTRNGLDDLVREVRRHIDDPHTLVLGGIFFQTWGRRPARQVN
jgi:SAM-dependent methyltransferase